jgi:hypothetical protein
MGYILRQTRVPANYFQVITSFTSYSKMNSSVDYTPVILAQLTDLQMRVTKQDATISALKAEIERLVGRPVTVSDGSTMRTSVPLRPNAHEYKPRGDYKPRDGPRDGPRGDFKPRDGANAVARSRPKVAGSVASGEGHKHPTMTLADVLVKDEMVTLQVGTGKDAEGKFTTTTALASFDGTDLTITACDLVPSLVDMKSSKPGEILYKFIDELKNAGHIKKTFTIAPWKLCFVTRNNTRMSLEELRSTVG